MTAEIQNLQRPPSGPRALGSGLHKALCAFLCTAILASATGCAGSEGSGHAGTELGAPERSARISQLQEAIARDHATLQSLVTRPREEVETPLYSDPTLHVIAHRLGDQERELVRLLEAEVEAEADSPPAIR